jgi:predicted transglutaminase-like cysteine proteinase
MVMGSSPKVAALVTILVAMAWSVMAWSAMAGAAPLGPSTLQPQPQQIRFNVPVLPPIGHTRFCLQYPADCQVHGFDVGRVALTAERWKELNYVNSEVNGDIAPEVTAGNGTTEEWIISPPAGDCKDYAITKRHQLLALGWPSRALLLAEVVVPDGEHHLVLVVRTQQIDLVLDNLNAYILTAAMTYSEYQWVRIETPQNPKFWARVQAPEKTRTAMLAN